MKKLLVLTAALLTACSGAETHSPELDKGIIISDAKIRPPMPGRDVATGYFSVANKNKSADRLLGAYSPISGRIEIHTHIDKGGVMSMRRVDDVELPAGKTVKFKSGGYHLMMFDTVLPEGQTDAAITLDFENAPDVTVIAEVNQPNGHSHGGHHNH